ncbi:MAG: PorP/SprF family type IX secretion system membrane protein [Crocinitomicaceae bacterium]|nr:PorP/SprF family type IX secretion system membrane protein [Crocinitomicaceae bacterium]
MKKIVTFILIVFCVVGVQAQDPNFSQFYNNPVYYNPGMISLNSGYSVKLHARNLWAPVPGRFNTFAASFEGQIIPKLAMAVNAYTDVAGEALLRTTGGYLTYAYRPIETKNFMLQVGVNGGIINKYIDWSKLRFSDNYHEIQGEVGTTAFIAPSYRSTTYADFGSGISIRFNHEARKYSGYRKLMATFGFSALHLTQPKEGLMTGGKLPIKLVASFNTAILVNETIISPAIIYENQNRFQTATIGFSVIQRPIIVGAWIRNEGIFRRANKFDSFVLNFGVNFPTKKNQVVKVMYSIDFTISQLRSASFGSHELSLVYDWNDRFMSQKHRMKRSRQRTYQCPKDFMGI